MPIAKTKWTWEEAFNKFGFNDGDGENFTFYVSSELEDYGATNVLADTYGIHNYMIFEATINGTRYEFSGYDDPRSILPPDLVAHLDDTFPPEEEW